MSHKIPINRTDVQMADLNFKQNVRTLLPQLTSLSKPDFGLKPNDLNSVKTERSQNEKTIRKPQFRVTVNSRCGRACFFCRPSGEAVATEPDVALRLEDLVRVGTVIRRFGIESVKLTGGDPALYEPLEDGVLRLRQEVGFREVEVISRHPIIGRRAAKLAHNGVTQFNISVDTLVPELHHEITGKNDLAAVLEALKSCVATGVPVKVNMVVMAGVNDLEVAALATYCEKAGVRILKLLDVIKDLDAGGESFAKRLAKKRAGRVVHDLYVPLGALTRHFASSSVTVTTRIQGGLGHPMTVLTMKSGFEIVVKDNNAGAWYGDICRGCSFFPCHDALMALRLTADLRLQFCLLREDITIPLAPLLQTDNGELESTISEALKVYARATFRADQSAIPATQIPLL